MNALFHLNMQFQQAAVEKQRQIAQHETEKATPDKDSAAYLYLVFIFKKGRATSQLLNAIPHPGTRQVNDTLRFWIKREYISYERVNQMGGIYRPCEGITADMLGIDLEDNK